MNYCNCPNCRTDNCPNAESPVEKADPASGKDGSYTGQISSLKSRISAQREEIVQNQGEWATLMASVQEDFANEKADRGRGRVTLVLTLLGQLRYQRDTQREEIEKLRAEQKLLINTLQMCEQTLDRNPARHTPKAKELFVAHKEVVATLAALTKPQPPQT